MQVQESASNMQWLLNTEGKKEEDDEGIGNKKWGEVHVDRKHWILFCCPSRRVA